MCKPDETRVPESDGWTGAGTAWKTYEAELTGRFSAVLKGHCCEIFPRAQNIAALGVIAVNAGLAVSTDEAQPVYLRNNVAVKKKS